MFVLSVYNSNAEDADGANTAAATADDSVNDDSCDVTSQLSPGVGIQRLEEEQGRSGDVCLRHGRRDDYTVFTTRLWNQVCT